jgi:TolB-like protein
MKKLFKHLGPVVIGIALGAFLPACAGRPLPETIPAPASKIPTVAVLEFHDQTVGPGAGAQGIGRSLTDRVTEELAGRPGLRLIERESLQKVLEELSLSSRNLAEADSQLRLGKLLGAQYLIAGGVTAVGSALRVDGRIIEVEKGGVDGTSLEGTLDGRAALERAFSNQMADRLDEKIGILKSAPVTPEGYFLRGAFFEQSNDPARALEMYQKSLSLDPQNQEARNRMENLLLKELQ